MSRDRVDETAKTPPTARTSSRGWALAGLIAQLVVASPLAVELVAALTARVLVNLDRYWDGLRLAPVFALVRGNPLYPRIDQGPLLSFCYGPVSALAYLPATLAPSPSYALLAASVITLAISLLPIAWIAFRPGGSGPLAFLAFGFAMLLNPSLSYSLFSPVHDAVALSLGMTACLLLVSAREELPRGRLILSAASLALAVWSKQNAVFLAPALPSYLWILRGRSVALRFVSYAALSGVALGVAFCLAFGFEGLKFNLIEIPRRHATSSGWGEALSMLWGGCWPFLAAVAIGLAFRPGQVADRGWWRTSPSGLLLVAALMLVPVSLMGLRKEGGGLNSLSFTIDFLAAAAVGFAAPRTGPIGLRRLGLPVLAGATAIALGVTVWLTRDTIDAKRIRDNPHEQAFRFARQHPGAVYFPWNGLSTLMADGHLDHVEDGFVSAEKMAGFQISESVVREYLPKRARFIAYPPGFNETSWGGLYMRKYLPGPKARRPVDGLREWLIFEIRPAPGS